MNLYDVIIYYMNKNILYFGLIIIFLIIYKIIFNEYNIENFNSINELCCIYAYYEKNEQYKENFKYFLKNGICEQIDYYFVINGFISDDIDLKKYLNKSNIKFIYRENKGWDFGAYSHVLNNYIYNIKKYNYYIFLNTSVIGPLVLGCNAESLVSDRFWFQPFLDLFNKPNIKIVGTSINMYSKNEFNNQDLHKLYGHINPKNSFRIPKSLPLALGRYSSKAPINIPLALGRYSSKAPINIPFSHVQSMFFIIDHEYLDYLWSKDFFNESRLNNLTDINQVIYNYEFALSQYALNNGWNINCILDYYKDIDYLNAKEDINPTSIDGDPYYLGAYFGSDIDPKKIIFFKNNRF